METVKLFVWQIAHLQIEGEKIIFTEKERKHAKM